MYARAIQLVIGTGTGQGVADRVHFLLEAAAIDMAQLIEDADEAGSSVVDTLFGMLLELDQEIKEEGQEESLLGVHRAQIQLATYFTPVSARCPTR